MTATKPIRILHVVGALNQGGIETWLLRVLHCLDRSRYQVDFLVHTAAVCAYDAEMRALGSHILPCVQPSRPWSYARRFRQILQEHGPYDVVHSHVHSYSGMVLRLASQAGVSIRIAHSHTTEKQERAGLLRRAYLGLMRRWLSRYATACLSVSQEAQSALFGRSDCLDDRYQVLHCGIDLTSFRMPVNAAAVRAEWSIPSDGFVLGHVGRLVPCKNHTLLLALTADLPNAYLLLVGDGPLRPALEEEATRRGVRDRVLFAGARSDVPRLLAAMDVFVFPSHYEGLPMAVVEAQAAGIPCVLSSAVTQETAVVLPLVRQVSLTAPNSTWKQAILTAKAVRASVDRDKARTLVEQSTFNIRTGVERLQEIYLHPGLIRQRAAHTELALAHRAGEGILT